MSGEILVIGISKVCDRKGNKMIGMKQTLVEVYLMRWIVFLLVGASVFSCDRIEKEPENVDDRIAFVRDSIKEVNDIRLEEAFLASSQKIRQTIENRQPGERYIVLNTPLYSSVLLPRLYIENEFNPIWVQRYDTLGKVSQMIHFIENAAFHGLNPEHYHLTEIKDIWETMQLDSAMLLDENKVSNIDLLLSDAFFMLASHLYYGKVDHETLEAQWGIRRSKPDLALDESLHAILKQGNIEEGFFMFYPPFPGYTFMYREAKRLKAFIQKDFEIDVDLGNTIIKSGDSSVFIKAVKDKLYFLGLYEPDTLPATNIYDEKTVTAIKKIQTQFGFNADGTIGRNALKALNMPIEKRIEQLYVNMERLRWMPDSLESKHILVNIADFTLDVFQHSDTLLSMRTIVGKDYRETPVFSALITYLVFSPSWTVPPTIMRNDVLPEVIKNTKYLSEKNMIAFDAQGKKVDPAKVDWKKNGMRYTIRQSPGNHNALGKVKFMFPNKYNVYLHDTPSRSLFARDERTFSSGCIRIEKPFDLAVILMDNMPEWTPERIRQAMNSGNEKTVVLKSPAGVYVYYLTAWASSNGVINYRSDIYNRDKNVLEALLQRKN